MYIPDKVKIVIVQGRGARVYSADAGHESEQQMSVASARVTWDELDGMTAVVTYGSRIVAIGTPSHTPVVVTYLPSQVTFSVSEE